MYGDNALKETKYLYWFSKFRSGNFSLKNEPRSGRPSNVDEDDIKAFIELDRHINLCEIEEKLKVPKSTASTCDYK